MGDLPDLWRPSTGPLTRMTDDRPIGDILAEHGRVVLLTTHGRVSGRPASAAVGFIEEPDGALLVAAGSTNADWALNLTADPDVSASWGGRTRRFRAELLDTDAFAAAIRQLILRYGTPAEGLGSGPAFRLHPLDDHRSDPAPTPNGVAA